MVFPVVMYEFESWTIKRAETWRTDTFKLWCWRDAFKLCCWRKLQSPLDCKEIKLADTKGNQPWMFYPLNGLMLKQKSNTLATWYKQPTHWKRPWCWQRLKAKKEESSRGWNGYTALLTHGYEFEQTPGNREGQRSLVCCDSWGCKELDMTEWLNWSDLKEEAHSTLMYDI